MADAEWIENIRKIALQAVAAGNPCDLLPGTVTKTSPLEIQIDQKNVLYSEQILVTVSMTDHDQDMTIPEIGDVRVAVKNGLKVGEKVILFQERGAQRFLVLDRWQKGG